MTFGLIVPQVNNSVSVPQKVRKQDTEQSPCPQKPSSVMASTVDFFFCLLKAAFVVPTLEISCLFSRPPDESSRRNRQRPCFASICFNEDIS